MIFTNPNHKTAKKIKIIFQFGYFMIDKVQNH